MNNRGTNWLRALTANTPLTEGFIPSIEVVDYELQRQKIRFINVAIDANNPFPRAAQGEVGLLEGWQLANAVLSLTEQDRQQAQKTPIVAIIDVPSQAYGRREEAYGIHLALAAAANAYATARLDGHPVIGLIVGKAMSGGFLAHGYQANRLIALNDPGCMVHAMGKESAARVTMRSVEQLEALAKNIPPMAYDIDSYRRLGLLHALVDVSNAQAPEAADIKKIHHTLRSAISDACTTDLHCRLGAVTREASTRVRTLMKQAW